MCVFTISDVQIYFKDMESHLRTGNPTDYETMLEKGVMLISKDQKPEYGYVFNLQILYIAF